MTENPALSALTDHFRRFLEAVKAACGLHARPGPLAGPMALLMWIRTRRMRKEAAAMMEQALRALMEQFAVLLDEYRAGKLNAQDATVVQDPLREAELLATGPIEDSAPLRSSAPSTVTIPRRRERRQPQRPRGLTNERVAKPAQSSASRTPSVCFAARPRQSGERERVVADWRPLNGYRISRVSNFRRMQARVLLRRYCYV